MKNIESQPENHGRWLRNPNGQSIITCRCSECGRAVYNIHPEKIYKFCFNCGARMVVEEIGARSKLESMPAPDDKERDKLYEDWGQGKDGF